MAAEGQRLRDSIIESLHVQPLLVEVEQALHSNGQPEMQGRFRHGMIRLLEEGSELAEAHPSDYRGFRPETVENFRAAMAQALRTDSSLVEAEKKMLESIGLEKLGQFRSTMRAHLSGPAEVAEQDLAIYVPADEGHGQAFKQALQEQLADIDEKPMLEPFDPAGEGRGQAIKRALQEQLADIDEVPMLEPLEQEPSGVDQPLEPPAESGAHALPIAQAVLPTGAPVGRPAARRKSRHKGLNPVPMLTAALDAIGDVGPGFGFILRYGHYAPKGRSSEFVLGGMGLEQLSTRLTAWLEEQGPLEGQVQVLDEGSGELTIYLLGEEGSELPTLSENVPSGLAPA